MISLEVEWWSGLALQNANAVPAQFDKMMTIHTIALFPVMTRMLTMPMTPATNSKNTKTRRADFALCSFVSWRSYRCFCPIFWYRVFWNNLMNPATISITAKPTPDSLHCRNSKRISQEKRSTFVWKLQCPVGISSNEVMLEVLDIYYTYVPVCI